MSYPRFLAFFRNWLVSIGVFDEEARKFVSFILRRFLPSCANFMQTDVTSGSGNDNFTAMVCPPCGPPKPRPPRLGHCTLMVDGPDGYQWCGEPCVRIHDPDRIHRGFSVEQLAPPINTVKRWVEWHNISVAGVCRFLEVRATSLHYWFTSLVGEAAVQCVEAKINKKVCWYCGTSVCPPSDRWVCEDCYVVCCTRCFHPGDMLCSDCFQEYMDYSPGSWFQFGGPRAQD